MNHEEQIEKLAPEARAFYNHQLRGGSTHELVERRSELQMGMANRTLYGNHRAGVLAVAELTARIDPPPTDAERQIKTDETFITAAQRLFDAGDDAAAKRVMDSGGLDMSELQPRRPSAERDERAEKALKEFQIKRDQAINKLQLDRGISKREATNFFFGRGRYEPPKNPLAPMKHQAPASLADELRKQVNREN
jgi:hypothetical protein